MNHKQLRQYIIRPVLTYLDLHSQAAEDLIVGTAAQESRLGEYIHQLGDGPAQGIFQMEPATESDIWENYLNYRDGLAEKAGQLQMRRFDGFMPDLIGNLFYQTAMTRVHYLRVPEPLPDEGDVQAYAYYWKKFYNTPLGKGTEVEFIHNYNRMCV